MAKNIAFFSDGTWNGPGQDENKDGVPDVTNVLKLYDDMAGNGALSTLRMENEQEKELVGAADARTQVAKYIHGVGDSRNPLTKLLGGTFGAGIVQRIVRGYTYVSRNYRAGDDIFLIGFSRGAYTVRALGGMIARMGLLNGDRIDFEDREQTYRNGLAAWTRYRRIANKKSSLLDYLDEFKAARLPADGLIPDVRIKAIGVWDTVGALGIPRYAGDDARMDTFKFADTALSAKVAHGFHALAIDERRADFSPTHWDPRDGVVEQWFAGAHADVGGGYPESFLSDIALAWMHVQLAGVGLAFADPARIRLRPDPMAAIHEPWNDPIWKVRDPYVRKIAAGAKLDATVEARLRANLRGYPTEALRNYIAAGARAVEVA